VRTGFNSNSSELAKSCFISWADAAIHDVQIKAQNPVSSNEEPFILKASSVQEGADALLASIRRLVDEPHRCNHSAILAGFPSRIPRDVADYLHIKATFEL
jgi:hypothetical protein